MNFSVHQIMEHDRGHFRLVNRLVNNVLAKKWLNICLIKSIFLFYHKVVEGKGLASPDQISPCSVRRLSGSAKTDSEISTTKRRSIDHNKSFSDNDALEVQDLSDKRKTLYTNATRDGRKRNSSEDLKQYRPSSKGSLGSLNLSERSFSLNSISSSIGADYVDAQMVDQEGIVTLTVHVRKFSEALSKLRNAFSGSESDTESDGK